MANRGRLWQKGEDVKERQVNLNRSQQHSLTVIALDNKISQSNAASSVFSNLPNAESS